MAVTGTADHIEIMKKIVATKDMMEKALGMEMKATAGIMEMIGSCSETLIISDKAFCFHLF